VMLQTFKHMATLQLLDELLPKSKVGKWPTLQFCLHLKYIFPLSYIDVPTWHKMVLTCVAHRCEHLHSQDLKPWNKNTTCTCHIVFIVVQCLEVVGHNKNQISYQGGTKKSLEILLKWILFYSLKMDKVDKIFAT
jgi:hypothetical protein